MSKEKINISKGELEGIIAAGMGYVWNLNQDEKGMDGYHKKEEKRIEIVNHYFNKIKQNETKMSKEIDDSYNRYLIYTILGINNGFDAIKGYLDNCLVEFEGKYEHFTNPWFSYGWRPYTKEEFIKYIDKLKPKQR